MVSFSSIATGTAAFVLLSLDNNSFSVDAWMTTTKTVHHHHHRPSLFATTKLQYSPTGSNDGSDDGSDNNNNVADDPSSLISSYFHMQQIPTATSGKALDHIVDCADNGECNIEEMMDMIDELEQLNAECEGEHSRECNLDAIAARNVLKVALASKVMVEDALSLSQEVDEECSVDVDYASMAELEDECQPHYYHQVPSDTTDHSNNLDHIIECGSESGECDVEEMTKMIEELEKLNMECESTLSRECSLDAVAARNILKVALASKVTLEESIETRANGAQPYANGSP